MMIIVYNDRWHFGDFVAKTPQKTETLTMGILVFSLKTEALAQTTVAIGLDPALAPQTVHTEGTVAQTMKVSSDRKLLNAFIQNSN